MHATIVLQPTEAEQHLAAQCVAGAETWLDTFGPPAGHDRTADLRILVSGARVDETRLQQVLATLDDLITLVEEQAAPQWWLANSPATPEIADGMATSRRHQADRLRNLATSLQTTSPAPGEIELDDADWLTSHLDAGYTAEDLADELDVDIRHVHAAINRHMPTAAEDDVV